VATWVSVSLVLLLVGERVPQSFLRGAGATLFAPLDRAVLVSDRLAAAWRENQQLHQRLTELELENGRLRDLAVTVHDERYAGPILDAALERTGKPG